MDMVCGPVDGALLGAVDGLIEQGFEGHLDDLGHLVGAWLEEQRGGWSARRAGRGNLRCAPSPYEPGDDRGYYEAAHRHIDIRHGFDYLQQGGVYAKLLVGLAQSGEHGVGVRRVL